MAMEAPGGHGGRGLPVHESAKASSEGRSARDVQRHRARRLAMVGAVLMLASGAAAKASHCRKDCKQDIKSCLALLPPNQDCTGTKAAKQGCRQTHAAQRKTCRSLTKLCKQQNPSTSGTCLPASTIPSTTSTTTTTTTRPPTTTSTTSTTTTTTSTTTSSTSTT